MRNAGIERQTRNAAKAVQTKGFLNGAGGSHILTFSAAVEVIAYDMAVIGGVEMMLRESTAGTPERRSGRR